MHMLFHVDSVKSQGIAEQLHLKKKLFFHPLLQPVLRNVSLKKSLKNRKKDKTTFGQFSGSKSRDAFHGWDSNQRHTAYHADALPAEPPRQLSWADRIFEVYTRARHLSPDEQGNSILPEVSGTVKTSTVGRERSLILSWSLELFSMSSTEREKEGGRGREREGVRGRGREGGREGGRKGGREGGREEGKEGGRKRERERRGEGRKGGGAGGRRKMCHILCSVL